MDFTDLEERATGFDQLVSFEELLGEAEQPDEIVSIPETEVKFGLMTMSHPLFMVVWSRLYQLGYLNSKMPTPYRKGIPRSHIANQNRTALKDALKLLQKEADITPDGWLGAQTWSVLQQIYSFDEASNLEKWTRPQYSSLFMRALEVRFRVLGLISDGREPIFSGIDFSQSVQSWIKFITTHTKSSITLPPASSFSYLFDLDLLTPLLYANFSVLKSDEYEFGTKLLHSVLCAELWLEGKDGITPGMDNLDSPLIYEGSKGLSPTITSFCKEENLAVDEDTPPDEILKTCLEFFAKTEIAKQSAPNEQFESIVQAIIGVSKSESNAQILANEMKRKNWGAWLFDGIKHALRWVYRQIKKGISWVKEKIISLANAIKKISVQVTSFFRRTIQTLSDGISVFTNKLFEGSTEEFAIYRDKDFDFKIYIANSASEENVRQFLDSFNRLWKRVYQAMAICLILVHIIREAMTLSYASLIGLPYVIARFYRFFQSTEYQFIREAYS